MEYSMVNMASVASNIPPYSTVMKDGETGLLCNEDEKQWEDAIDRLILDKSLRQTLASNAKEEVLKNHNIHTKVHLWQEAYANLLNPQVV
jgi:glycosyltransferase involved in cell wall biosynthesis